MAEMNGSEVTSDDYDGLVPPGGVGNPDTLRMDEDAVRFARTFLEAGKHFAVICHGPRTLVEAYVVRDRTLTSYPSIKTDIENADGNRVDEEVVVDDGLISSRDPDDLPAFCRTLVEEFAVAPVRAQLPAAVTPSFLELGYSEAELRDAGAVAVFESVEELRGNIDKTPLSFS